MIELLRDLPFKTYFGLFLCSLFTSYWLAPRISWLARGLRLHPRTRSAHDYHSHSLGGLATGLPFILGISLLLLLKNQVSENMYMVPLQMRGLFLGSCAILALGLLQDLFILRRPLRFALQIAVALIGYYYGFRTDLSHIGETLIHPTSDLWLSLIWIVGLVNLLDLLNRFFATFLVFTLLLILMLMGVAFTLDEYRTIVVYCLLAGGLLGLLSHDKTTRPAFGSTGAYFIGYTLAITTLQNGIATGTIEILSMIVALSIAALIFLLSLPKHLPFPIRKKTTDLKIKSLNHHRLATTLKIQITSDPAEAWDALCRAAGDFDYRALSLRNGNGIEQYRWGTCSPSEPPRLELPMQFSGGRLFAFGDVAANTKTEDARAAFFSALVGEFDKSRELSNLDLAYNPTVPLRALLVNRYYGGAAATGQLVEELAEDLAASGIAVTVLTGDLGYETTSILPGRNEFSNGVHIHRISSTQFGRGTPLNRIIDFAFFYFSSIAWIAKTAPDRHTHILTFTDPPLIAVLGGIAQRIKRWRFIYAIQDLYPDTALALGLMRQGPVFRLFQRINRHLLHRADAVVTISRPMEDLIRAQTTAPITVRRIANWADGKKIKPAPAKDQRLIAELGLSDVYTAIYAGNMGLAQEIEVLIEIIKACKDNNTIQFLFMGGGAKRYLIEQAIAEASICNARILDYQHKTTLDRFLALGDIGIVSLSPSMEGLALPSKTYSYLAAGLPILSIAAEGSELADYASMGLGIHFHPQAIESIVRFLEDQASEGSNFSHSEIRRVFAEQFARPVRTSEYARMLREA
jgi:hypothetical protein